MSENVFYKIGEYEILLNNVDAVTSIKTNNRHQVYFEVIVDGAIIEIYRPEQREEFVKAWKDCIG